MDYYEIQSNKELRACAREQLNGVWGKMAFAFFVMFLIYLPYYLLSVIDGIYMFQLQEPVFSEITKVLYIFLLIANGPFSLGFAGYFLKRVRNEEFSTKNIFDGFKRFFPSFALMILTAIFIFLWSLLLIIPGIIKSLSYSMAFYIMYDNPEIEPLEALEKSQIMMKGYKWKLFLLLLSFIGWALLVLLTLGIGYFWLLPYIYLSIANFYENLKISQEKI